MKGYSLESFAKLIGKSPSTLSKYENGNISIDIETLFEISMALNLDISHFVDCPIDSANQKSLLPTKTIFGDSNELYMYFYDGRINSIVCSLIKGRINEQTMVFESYLFMGLDSFDKYENCKYYYHGEFKPNDIVSTFMFENQSNSMEHLVIYISNPLGNAGMAMGLIVGVSAFTFLPTASKVMLSRTILREDEYLKNLLVFSKDDIRAMKKQNLVSVENPK